MIDALFQYNPWWEDEYHFDAIIPRVKYIELLKQRVENEQIIFLTGLRRVGKTTLMKLLIKELIENYEIEKKHVLYVSLDDYVFKDNSILEIIDEYRKAHRLSVDEKVYLFLDEVIYKEDFHQQLKTIFDRQNTKIFATSSSSIRLKDKKAFLTGRSYVIEVSPLDFNEFLYFKEITISMKDIKLLEPYFRDYLRTGGIPYYVLSEEREFLVGLVDDIIYKDIISEHGVPRQKKFPQLV